MSNTSEQSKVTIMPSGMKLWMLPNGQLHRKDGPAVEYPDGSFIWYFNGVIHRLNDPAIVWSNGTKEWWNNGRHMYSEKHSS